VANAHLNAHSLKNFAVRWAFLR